MSVTFYRDQLRTKQAREFYDRIYTELSSGNESGIFSLDYTFRATAARDGFAALEALRKDRPEFFFLGRGCRSYLWKNRVVLMTDMPYTPDQVRKIRSRTERLIRNLTVGTEGLPEWEREKLIYERLVRHLIYIDHGTEEKPKEYDHSIVGPVLGSGVCEGFSCLLMMVLRKVGIPCIRVSGFGKKEAHCWNMAWIDGVPVHLDITWDCMTDRGDVGFFYFNLTDEQITRDHRITTPGLPACSDPTKGYHFRNDLVFTSARDAGRFFKTAFSDSSRVLTVRFSGEINISPTVKKAMRQVPVRQYRYRYNDEQCTALIWCPC